MSKISKTICISLNERIYDDKRNMKKNNLQNSAVLIFMLAFLVSSCLKEAAVPIESAFSIESSGGLVCNYSTKHLKLLGMWVKVILDEVALQLYIISSGKRYNFMR